MHPETNSNWERRLQEIENQLHQSQVNFTNQSSANNISQIFKMIAYQALHWFNQLPKVGKFTSLVVLSIFSLAFVQALIQLVSLVISFAIIGFLGFFGYKVFREINNNNNSNNSGER